jgi:heptosyltransferase-2
LQGLGVERKRYAVLHVGGGAALKEWPLEHWVAVARELLRRNIPVVLTGAGRSDAVSARAIRSAVTGTINLCDELSWPEFRCVISLASLVLSVDTVAMHLAAAEGTPCVAVRTGIDTPNRWDPPAASVRVLAHPVSCAPCYRSRGCSEMLCVRGVEPAQMLESAEPFMHAGR